MNPSPTSSNLRWAVWLLALVWGVGPALPAWTSGMLVGQPYTDLYPAVWGLWWAAEQWPSVVTHTTQLGYPEGMGFYYSSPLKGWLAGLLVPRIGLVHTWNLLLVASRVATVVGAAAAARAWGLGTRGSLVVAAGFGCSAVFQGYAVEGIIEGTDGWALALWAWAVARERAGWSMVGLALCVVTSWYLGAVACLLAVLATLRHARAWWSLGGILLAAPSIVAFLSAFSGGPPLAPDIRAAMGAPIHVPRPGVLDGLHPFALTAYTGFILAGAALGARVRWVALALLPAILSLGVGPWYDLPVLSALRFPYRWHLGTLAILSLAAGHLADRVRGGGWIAVLVVAENLLLAPVEPILPSASADLPALYRSVDAPVLDIPGPVSLPPGEVNLSRPRARWFLFGQTMHGQATPWIPDFNGVGADTAGAEWLSVEAALAGFDRVAGGDGTKDLALDVVTILRGRGVRWIMIHHRATGMVGAARLRDQLVSQGAIFEEQDEARWLLHLP